MSPCGHRRRRSLEFLRGLEMAVGMGSHGSDLADHAALRFVLVVVLIATVRIHRCLRVRRLDLARKVRACRERLIGKIGPPLVAAPTTWDELMGNVLWLSPPKSPGSTASRFWLRRGVRSGGLGQSDQAEPVEVGEC